MSSAQTLGLSNGLKAGFVPWRNLFPPSRTFSWVLYCPLSLALSCAMRNAYCAPHQTSLPQKREMFPTFSNGTIALPSPHCRPLTAFTGTMQRQVNITESIKQTSGTKLLMTIFTAVNFHSQLLLRTDLVTTPPFRASCTNHADTHVASHTELMAQQKTQRALCEDAHYVNHFSSLSLPSLRGDLLIKF